MNNPFFVAINRILIYNMQPSWGCIMKRGLCFIENEHLFNFVLSAMYFNEARKEKEIFILWRKGYNNCDIAKQVGYTEGTIRNRKKDLTSRCNFLIQSQY